MPAVITHYLFGKEMIPCLPAPPACSSVFNWGTQGPDIFFFTPPLSAESRRIIQTGYRMHEQDVEEILAAISKQTIAAFGMEKSILTSYLYGYLAHYILDSTFHPFVYAMQRHLKAQIPDASDAYIHRLIETNLDVIFLQKLRGLSIRTFPIFQKLRIKPELAVVCRMYAVLLRERYGLGFSAARIQKSFSGMKTAYALLYSPRGIKRGAITATERLIGRRHPEIAALSHRVNAQDTFDFANLKREVGEQNAFELFAAAAQRYKDAVASLSQIFAAGTAAASDFTVITHGINFEGSESVSGNPAPVEP